MDLLTLYDPQDEFSSSEYGIQPLSFSEGDDQILFRGFSSALLNFAFVCCVVFMCIGIPGNLITIIALARCKKIRNATAVFIINLSLSDLLFCCFNLPLAASIFYRRKWVHGDLMCRLFPLLRYGLLAVSLFTILAITINRYIMIGHPRIYPRVYRRKFLMLMVALTWVSAFGSLIQTWRGKWGTFGLDVHIGSCSILPAANGSSPKEFLFVMAFALPCLAIVLSYARIFYIVRRATLKTHENLMESNGVALSSNSSNSNSAPKDDQPVRKMLSKRGDEDIKFIDASFETDLPPSLSQLQRSKQSDPQTPSPSPASIESNCLINNNQTAEVISEKKRTQNNNLNITASKSDPLQHETSSKPRNEIHHVKRGSTMRQKVKQRQLKNHETSPKEMLRKKSIANSGASMSILIAGKLSSKDRKLLKMILVIFISFLFCYLPITLTKVLRSMANVNSIFIISYLLVYLTTCINPIIYCLMSLEYRKAYVNLLTCQTESDGKTGRKR